MKTAAPTRIIFKNYTQLEWYDSNPVLAVGEAGYENDIGGLKFGDGTTSWRELPYSCQRGLGDGCSATPTT